MEAKSEIIALHHSIRVKDQELVAMRKAVSDREMSLSGLLQQYNLMKQHVDDLSLHNQVCLNYFYVKKRILVL